MRVSPRPLILVSSVQSLAFSDPIDRILAELDAERSTEGFAKKKEGDARRHKKAQAEYVEDFHGAVVTFLAFHTNHTDVAARMARAVTDHAPLSAAARWPGPSVSRRNSEQRQP